MCEELAGSLASLDCEAVLGALAEKKGTGTERPGVLVFEEPDLDALLPVLASPHSPAITCPCTAAAPARARPAQQREQRGLPASSRKTPTCVPSHTRASSPRIA